MPMYNLIEYSDNYLKRSGILWQFYRNVPDLGNFTEANATTESFNLKQKLTGQTGNNDTKHFEIVTLKICK